MKGCTVTQTSVALLANLDEFIAYRSSHGGGGTGHRECKKE